MKCISRCAAVVAVAIAPLLLLAVAPSASAAAARGTGTFSGTSDERGGFTCRTADFQFAGTLTVGYRQWKGPFTMTFRGCPDGVNPGPDDFVLAGTDRQHRTLTGTCGVHTHWCWAAIVPSGGTPEYAAFQFRYANLVVTPTDVVGVYAIAGKYTET